MKKKILIIAIIFVFALIVIGSKFLKKENKTSYNTNYAILIDGVSADAFPARGDYTVDVSCSNAKGKWDYSNWNLLIDNVTGNASCDISFISITKKDYLNKKIINLVGTTQGDGKIIHEIGNYPQMFGPNVESKTTRVLNNTNGYSYTFTPTEEGEYQICFTIPTTSSSFVNDRLWVEITSSAYTVGNNRIYGGINRDCNGCSHCLYTGSADEPIRYSLYFYPFDSKSMTLTINKLGDNSFDADIRYEGNDPNNYVWFNNELWRIIGVFSENTHSQTGQKLVKLVRNQSIGSYTFGASPTSNNYWWTSSYLYKLLNGSYVGSYISGESTSCYATDGVTGRCVWNNIATEYRSMIKQVTWKFGAMETGASFYAIPSAFYSYERLTRKYYRYGGWSNAITDANAKVGLIYPSDYGFAALEEDCTRYAVPELLTSSGKYSKYYNGIIGCEKNWLRSEGNYWTMTPFEDSLSTYYIDTNYQQISRTSNNTAHGVRPALYLDESVYVVDGDGSITDPYILKK